LKVLRNTVTYDIHATCRIDQQFPADEEEA
jgi:sarcosine oxidase delta subunit